MAQRKRGEFYGNTVGSRITNELTLYVNRYEAGQHTPPHSHQIPLLYFVTAGRCTDGARNLTDPDAVPGTAVFLPAGEIHSTRWSGADRCACFHVELAGADWNRRLEAAGILKAIGPARFQNDDTAALVRRLHAEFTHWDGLSSLTAEGIALELLASIARTSINTRKSPRTPKWLATVEEILRAEYTAPLSIERLAGVVEVDPTHLIRAFRIQYGCTPGEFVRKLRIEAACRALNAAPNAPMGDLAQSLGFTDQSHFIRTFRRITGVTPGAYRK